jgi:putative transposase
MARSARIVAPDYPYHITQRGNYRQAIFENKEDRQKYLSWIDEYSQKYSLSLLAYCLMDNHVHFIAVPRQEDSLSKVFSIVHMRYSQYFNKKMSGSGHLWQGRFYSSVLDETHLLAAVRYVERNPVRSGLVTNAWEWEWSSAAFHTGRSNTEINLEDIKEILDIDVTEWEEYLSSEEDEDQINIIRRNTKQGRPVGPPGFIEEIGAKVGRALKTLPRGRPRKKKTTEIE